MSLRNSVTLIGHTGKEVEVTTFEKGGMKASVSLATNDYYTNAAGEKIEDTQWHNLTAFGKTAELFQKYVKKGSEIAVEDDAVHPFASVMVHVYVPAANPVFDEDDPPFDH